MQRACSQHLPSAVFIAGMLATIWGAEMSLKQTLIVGVVGAVGIVAARKFVPAIVDGVNTATTTNGQLLPFVPEIMPRNGWSFAFVAVPAIGAWYLSR